MRLVTAMNDDVYRMIALRLMNEAPDPLPATNIYHNPYHRNGWLSSIFGRNSRFLRPSSTQRDRVAERTIERISLRPLHLSV
jgi:hypothetical protein